MCDNIRIFLFLCCAFFLFYLTNEISVKKKLFINNVNNKAGAWITNGISFTANRKTWSSKWRNSVNKLNIKCNSSKNNFVKEKGNDTIEMNGVVEECLANTNFIVRIPNGEKFLCFISGKLRINKVKINLGDTVKIQIHKLNFEKRRGKIVFRYLQHESLKNKK
ncbi:translation initiation factor IF-1 [Plasmodium brasilianum]|uniref:Translation initiation factor IF-1, putative n=2 Tax=Plasmodium (Plasmodium) TaxID=418103 RepID=A0A1D3SPN8_PLAMA|nr:translation initiation factor IF-1, putative [Plasmodium malariae]KAI4836606.1 translation initiation factor IF-1 [Plasmodium brasilianum]SCO93882.1 translation initiation factor IF-1, putative [Plasmodium malariae]